jgi:hypothetical protein
VSVGPWLDPESGPCGRAGRVKPQAAVKEERQMLVTETNAGIELVRVNYPG